LELLGALFVAWLCSAWVCADAGERLGDAGNISALRCIFHVAMVFESTEGL